MSKLGTNRKHRGRARLAYAAGLVSLVLAIALSLSGGVLQAASPFATAPGLGAAASFSALGKAGVTNTGNSVLTGNVGADSSITGFPPGSAAGMVLAPDVDAAEADATTARDALTAQAAQASPTGPDLTGVTLLPGVYSVGSALLSGVLTLDGPGVYIFLVSSDLTASGSVSLINGASPCDVFWQVTSSAAITGGSFVGTIIAGASITFGDAVSLDGRALALTGNVTLINDSIFGPNCIQAPVATETPTNIPPSDTPVVPPATDVPTDVPPTGVPPTEGPPPATEASTGVPAATATDTTADTATATPGATTAATEASTQGPTATFIPGTAAATAGATAQFLIPATGADLSELRALASRQWMRVGLVGLGLGLVLLGFTLRRKSVR